jgi:fatty acid desaturase
VAATHQAYLATGGSSRRPYLFFLVGDYAVLGLLVGPAVAYSVPALVRSVGRPERERARTAIALLVAAALVGTVALDLVGLTRGEVERIWVPYAAWLTAATALRPPPGRRWLAAQAMTAILVEALVHSPW